MKSDKSELIIKIIELNEIDNYIVENFDLELFKVSKVNIEIQSLECADTSNVDMFYTNFLVINVINNFVADKFSISINL